MREDDPTLLCWAAISCAVFLACRAGDSVPGSSSAPSPAPVESATAAATMSAPTVSASAVDPSVTARGIRWALSCTPARLTMATRDQLLVEITATNEGKETVDALRRQMTIRSDVGGTPGRLFGNGHVEKEWGALPPGQSVSTSYKLGASLLLRAGDITISVTNDGAKATCAVHVDP